MRGEVVTAWLEDNVPIVVALASDGATAALIPAMVSSTPVATVIVSPHQTPAGAVNFTPTLGKKTVRLFAPQTN